jgi:hypothetical protein
MDDPSQLPIRIGKDHGKCALFFGCVFKGSLSPHRALDDTAVLIREVVAKFREQLFASGKRAVFVAVYQYAYEGDPGLSFVGDKVKDVGAEGFEDRLLVFSNEVSIGFTRKGDGEIRR